MGCKTKKVGGPTLVPTNCIWQCELWYILRKYCQGVKGPPLHDSWNMALFFFFPGQCKILPGKKCIYADLGMTWNLTAFVNVRVEPMPSNFIYKSSWSSTQNGVTFRGRVLVRWFCLWIAVIGFVTFSNTAISRLKSRRDKSRHVQIL